MGFLYWLPGKPLGDRERKASAIGYAFDAAAEVTAIETLTGPDNRPGTLYCDTRRHELAVKFMPEAQRWQKLPGVEAFAGLFANDAIEPAALERVRTLDGYLIELADGNTWKAPRAYEFAEQNDDELAEPSRFRSLLPRGLELDDNGKWEFGPVLPKFAELWKLATDWGAVRFGHADDRQLERFDAAGQINAAIFALAHNYVIGPAEVALLGLLTVEHARETLDRVIDRPTFDRLAKKKRAWLAARLSAGGSPGQEDSPPAAGQPSPTISS